MAHLDEQEWIALNEISYNITFIYDFDEMRKNFFDWLSLILDFDCSLFSLLKLEGTNIHLYKSFGYKVSDKYLNIWEKEIQDSKAVKLLVYGANSNTYLKSELVSKENLHETSIYKKFSKPLNLEYSMSTCFVFKNEPIGILQFFRASDRTDFSKRDKFIVEQLYKQVAYRLNYESKKSDTRFFYAKGYLEQIKKKYQFTDREMELFEYAIEGLTNIEIADRVNISIHTVKKHFHNLYDKMNVSGRVELLQTLPHSYSKINFDEL